MIKNRDFYIVSVFMIILFAFSAATAFSQQETVLKGIITEDLQLITDEGDVYDITDNDLTKELRKNINRKVEIKGIIATDEDTGCKYIIASSFKLSKGEDVSVD
jgi:hypothetical protein